MRFKVKEAQANFFDRPAVQRAMDSLTRRALSKGGAFIRQRARSSIRKRKKSSQPGQPPSSHSGELRQIYFAWDPSTKTVVIGPVKLNKPGEAPRVLEEGGEATIRRGGRSSRSSREPSVVRRARIKARPYMRPALEKEAPNLPGLFAGGLKR